MRIILYFDEDGVGTVAIGILTGTWAACVCVVHPKLYSIPVLIYNPML
jgi:hypothetical protein